MAIVFDPLRQAQDDKADSFILFRERKFKSINNFIPQKQSTSINLAIQHCKTKQASHEDILTCPINVHEYSIIQSKIQTVICIK